ncbi:MAG TPA: o-succinylbenzoate synthase [Firmicutes bacterium]|nr:o-succinylbenzoate synthase [Bacillota bacterium]
MKVKAINMYQIQIPFQEPFRISSGEVTKSNSIIVRVTSEEGQIGYGEAAPMDGDFYSDITPAHCWQILKELCPGLIGKEFLGEDDFARLEASSSFARAAIETALWDCLAQERKQPLYNLIGGSKRRIDCGLAVGIFDSIDELLNSISRYLKGGYRRVKIKIKPGWDVEPIKAVRRSFGEIPLFVDANAAYTIDDVDVFRELDNYNLMMYEQPFGVKALEEHAELARRVKTPVCLDEGVADVSDAKRAVELGSAKIINIKLQRVGGLGPALAIYRICHRAGIDLWCGTMPELGVGQAAGLHLATLPGFVYPSDLGPSLRFFKDDLVNPFLEMDQNGQIEPPAKLGLGVEVDQEKLERLATAKEEW